MKLPVASSEGIRPRRIDVWFEFRTSQLVNVKGKYMISNDRNISTKEPEGR